MAAAGPLPALAVTGPLLTLSAASYQPHPLQAQDRTWAEFNCYVDAWVGLLHVLGLDPVPAAACAFSADFCGDQWSFLKFPAEDLRMLYGIDVAEINVWRPVADHIRSVIDQGRLATVEVDAWWLPDTAGTSYRTEHTKTTIIPASINEEDQQLGYFHNAGYFELQGQDFDGIFRLGAHADSAALAPYVELIRFDAIAGSDHGFIERARESARSHLRRRPGDNPVRRLAIALEQDLGWLATQDIATFHQWAFGLLRQCGATASFAADFLEWDAARGATPVADAIPHFRTVATAAKTLQFQLARVVHGRAVDVRPALDQMTGGWQRGIEIAATHYGA